MQQAAAATSSGGYSTPSGSSVAARPMSAATSRRGSSRAATTSGAGAAPATPEAATMPRAPEASFLVPAADAGTASSLHNASNPLQHMQAQLQQHHDSLEQLAAAVSLLATGHTPAVDAADALSAVATYGTDFGRGLGGSSAASGSPYAAEPPETQSFSFARQEWTLPEGNSTALAEDMHGQASSSSSSINPATAGMHSGGFPPRLHVPGSPTSRGVASADAASKAAAAGAGLRPGPQLAGLMRLVQAGQVGHKMDFFDPSLLQKIVSELWWSAGLTRLVWAVCSRFCQLGHMVVAAKLHRLEPVPVLWVRDKISMGKLAYGHTPCGQVSP